MREHQFDSFIFFFLHLAKETRNPFRLRGSTRLGKKVTDGMINGIAQ